MITDLIQSALEEGCFLLANVLSQIHERYPEQFHEYLVRDLLRSYHREFGSRDPEIQTNWRKNIKFLEERGFRAPTMADDAAFYAASEEYLRSVKFKQ